MWLIFFSFLTKQQLRQGLRADIRDERYVTLYTLYKDQAKDLYEPFWIGRNYQIKRETQ